MDLSIPSLTGLRHRLAYLAGRYQSDRCRETAAALTYMSLFALVPLLTVLYATASAVPSFQGMEDRIQELLFEHLVPESSADLEGYFTEFSRQAKNLTGFGIAFLFATAVLMLRNIEQAFNLIWRARANRGPVSSFLLYWAVLTLAPITIGLGLGVSTYLASFAGQLERWNLIGISSMLILTAPYILQILGFTLVYAAVPNCRVPLRHAIVGGLLTAISFNIARALFTLIVAGSSITFIYGAFAAVPLFLLWIYISWNIVLVGAIVIHSLSAYQSDAQARRPLVLKALELLHLLWQRQAEGSGLRELELLTSRGHSVDAESWQALRDRLLHVSLLVRDEDGAYHLARDLHQVSLWQLQEWISDDARITAQATTSMPAWERSATQRFLASQRSRRHELAISVADLFSADALPEATRAADQSSLRRVYAGDVPRS